MCKDCKDCTRLRNNSVKVRTGCIEYTAHLNTTTGRAYFDVLGKRFIAARWYWQHTLGFLSHNECVLHKCDNVRCVNLEHLFIGSQAENIADRDAKGRNRMSATHCVNGHAFVGANVRLYGTSGKWRACRECTKINMRKFRARKAIAYSC